MIETKALTKLNKDLNKIGEELFETARKVPDVITRRLAIGANDIRNTIILSMRDTPKDGKTYKRGKKKHIASSSGNPPAIDSGELVRSIIFDVQDMEVEIGSAGGAPYAEALEFGSTDWSLLGGATKMAPRPWLEPAVKKHSKEIVNDIGESVFELIGKPFKGK